ncbi:cutinase-domain-containing protein [Penicillium argentinense]|uniref:Cutinase n=1 Tax=Penicillium argentinense TaxID=1131581 RepID=A0A9W9K136_9EURO|nr:cutinase-domain-containing protein [Penicillium argentinense]KAJ5089218.1 cutinase-domain-containing protein [Penicillium argentinense]
MKSAVLFYILSTAFAAPTPTIEERQLPGLGGSGSDSGLGALSSLLPGLGGSSGSSSGSLPSFSGLPGLGGSSSGSGLGALSSLFPSGGSSTGSGLGALSSLLPSSGSSGLGSLPGLGGSSSSLIKRQDISSLLGSGSTENGVTQNKGCQPLTFIFARGSTEMGNMGSIVGPPVAQQLNSLLNNKVTVQGVTYDAGIASNAELGANGGPIMAKLVKQALSQCPKTKVVVGGYSQGSMVVHNAANRLSAGQISAAVLFGDPFKMQSVGKLSSSKVKEFCASGDPVCENGMNVMAHITYGSDAKEAAQFLVQASGVNSS